VALVEYTRSGSEGTLHADSLFQLVVESWARGKNELEMIVHESTPESRTIQRVMHIALMSITLHRLAPSTDRAFMKGTVNDALAISARVNLTARASLS
jgi:hypothetical protein